MYRKKFGKDGLLAQVVWSTPPVRESARRGLTEPQEVAPLHRSRLVPLQPLERPLLGDYEGLALGLNSASTDARRL